MTPIPIENFFLLWGTSDQHRRDMTVHQVIMGGPWMDEKCKLYTTDPAAALECLYEFRKLVAVHPSAWVAFSSCIDAGMTPEMREKQLGWGAWFFLICSDIPDMLCKACVYSVLLARREQAIVDKNHPPA
jgi:hypothetical protein